MTYLLGMKKRAQLHLDTGGGRPPLAADVLYLLDKLAVAVELASDMAWYTGHKYGCAVKQGLGGLMRPGPCDCGLNEIADRLIALPNVDHLSDPHDLAERLDWELENRSQS